VIDFGFKKNIFISFKFTGEDFDNLKMFLKKVCYILNKNGNNVFCSFFLEEDFQKNDWSQESIYEYCVNRIAENDIFLAIIRGEHESKGMLLELEEAVRQNKKIILFIKQGLDHYEFRDKSDEVYEYDTQETLEELLKEI